MDFWEVGNNSNRSYLAAPLPEQGITALSPGQKIAAVILYTLIAIIATGGNAIVIFIVFFFKRMRTPTNYLIANLAFADLLMAILCIPFSYLPSLILDEWPFGAGNFGSVMCTIIHASQIVAVVGTSYTLVAISIDRFLAIMFPLKANLRLHKRSVWVVIIVVWSFSVVLSIPEMIARMVEVQQNGTAACDLYRWDIIANSTDFQPEHYGLCLFLIQYVIPLLVLILTYGGIGVVIWRTKVPGCAESSRASGPPNRRDTVRKMIPMMVLVTSLYAICWLPQNLLMNVLYDRFESLQSYTYIFHVYWACHTIAMSHSVVNPIIYCHRNKLYREGFAYVFRFIPWVHYSPNELSERRNTLASKLRFASSVAYTPVPPSNGKGAKHT